jgi:hypothetical protein
MADYTIDQLYQMADELSMKWWGVTYDGVIDLKNRRWKHVNGRFCAPLGSQKDIPPIIQMCVKRNAEHSDEEVERTLLHELVHWRLWSMGIPHQDSSRDFVREIERVGASVSGALKARRAYEKYAGK